MASEIGGRGRPTTFGLPRFCTVAESAVPVQDPAHARLHLGHGPAAALAGFRHLPPGRATDALDGFTARRFRLKSNLGLWLDPDGRQGPAHGRFRRPHPVRPRRAERLPLWLTAICDRPRPPHRRRARSIYIGIRGRTVFRPSLARQGQHGLPGPHDPRVLLCNALGIVPRLPGLVLPADRCAHGRVLRGPLHLHRDTHASLSASDGSAG